MATYCTDLDLKDVFPQIDEFDSKTQLFGWVVESGSQYKAEDSGLVTQLFSNGKSLGSAQADKASVDANDEWFYDSTNDVVYYYNDASNPIDLLMEAGEDFLTLKSRYRTNASKYFDAKVDANLPRGQWKDKDGNYDYIIVRTSALLACAFLIRAHDPISEVANALMEEANQNITSLNSGEVALSWQVTSDASSGFVREVGTISGTVRPVDTRGEWYGTWDKLKLLIDTTGGAIGTATYSVWTKSGSALKATKVVDKVVINGDYQTLSGGLEIRFAGADDSSTATVNDEWEVEVIGRQEAVDSGMRTRRITRGG